MGAFCWDHLRPEESTLRPLAVREASEPDPCRPCRPPIPGRSPRSMPPICSDRISADRDHPAPLFGPRPSLDQRLTSSPRLGSMTPTTGGAGPPTRPRSACRHCPNVPATRSVVPQPGPGGPLAPDFPTAPIGQDGYSRNARDAANPVILRRQPSGDGISYLRTAATTLRSNRGVTHRQPDLVRRLARPAPVHGGHRPLSC